MTHFSGLLQSQNPFQSCAQALRRQLHALIGVALLLGVTAATAVPVTWTLNNVVTLDNITLSGSFVFDADFAPMGPGAFTAVNITAVGPGGNGPFTQSLLTGNMASIFGFNQAPAGNGQFAVGFIPTAALTNAGGTRTLTTGVGQGGMLTCFNAACTLATATAGRHLISGTISAPFVAVTVPTLNQ
jgi:hypothetical protein